MNENPSEFVGNNRPVEQVSLDDTVVGCDKLTEIERIAGRLPEGMIYALPTEAVNMPAGRHDHGVLVGRYHYINKQLQF